MWQFCEVVHALTEWRLRRGYIRASVWFYPLCEHLRKFNFVFLDLTYPGPEASLSALKFFLDLGSDGYRQCYTYSVQLAVEVFFFVCVMFSSRFFYFEVERKKAWGDCLWAKSLSGEEQNNAFCIYFILVYYCFIFRYLRAFFRSLLQHNVWGENFLKTIVFQFSSKLVSKFHSDQILFLSEVCLCEYYMLFGRGDGALLTPLWPGFDSWCHM